MTEPDTQSPFDRLRLGAGGARPGVPDLPRPRAAEERQPTSTTGAPGADASRVAFLEGELTAARRELAAVRRELAAARLDAGREALPCRSELSWPAAIALATLST